MGHSSFLGDFQRRKEQRLKWGPPSWCLLEPEFLEGVVSDSLGGLMLALGAGVPLSRYSHVLGSGLEELTF